MKRFRITETGYRFDKLIFLFMFIIFCSLVFLVMYNNKFDFSTHPYLNCKNETCKNPFYKDSILKEGQLQDCNQQLNILWVIPIYKTKDCRIDCGWCDKEFLNFGEYGNKPKFEFLLNNLWWLGLLIIIIGLVINHIVHNRGKKFDIEIIFTENKKLSLRKLIDAKDENTKDSQ